MKRLATLTVALCLPATFALAEETPGEPPSLIPELIAPVAKKKPKTEPEPATKSATEQASDDLQSRIRWREAKTRALQDPRIRAEWNRAHAEKTDPGKRDALKSYYSLFYDRMAKIDPALKPRLEALRKSLASRLDPRQSPREREKLLQPAKVEDRESPED